MLKERVSRNKVIIGGEGEVQARWLDRLNGAIRWMAALVESWASFLGVLVDLLRSLMRTILLISCSEIGLDDELILIC